MHQSRKRAIENTSFSLKNNSAAAVRKQDFAKAFSRKEKLNILLIGNQDDMRDYICSCFDQSIYNILKSTNGEQGIQIAKALTPDLIISDVELPKKSGYEVTLDIRNNANTFHIPIILLIMKDSLEGRLKGIKCGADACLPKPINSKELVLRAQNLIEIRRYIKQTNQKLWPIEAEDQQEDDFLIQIRTYVSKNIDQSNFTVNHMSKHFSISRVHLYRKLKLLTGQSVSDFIRSIRIKKAVELIEEGKSTMTEISYLTGFSSPSHFSRSFKKAYGFAPSKMLLVVKN